MKKQNKRTTEITLSIRPTKEALEGFASALHHARDGTPLKKKREISFEDIDTLRTLLTKARLELLSAIKRSSPKSIYELSKILKRDLKSVNTDIELLSGSEFITLRKEKNGRAKTTPLLNFDSLRIDVEI